MRPETVWLLIFSKYQKINRLNTFENGKPQLFNSGGVVKKAYFQKKWSVPGCIDQYAISCCMFIGLSVDVCHPL